VEENRFCCAHPGDHLLVPFQCDLCSFQNLCDRNPDPGRPQDEFILCCIRRANLDSFWGRESLTVSATLWGAQQLVSRWRLAHVPIDLPERVPFPVQGVLGMRGSIGMLIKSLEPGRYSSLYQQFETIRKLWAAHSNMFMSSLEGINAPYGSSVLSKGASNKWGKMSGRITPGSNTWCAELAKQ